MKFTDYRALMACAGYEVHADTDKITNIIYALVWITDDKEEEMSFRYNFEYGDYSKWMAAAQLYNTTLLRTHRILLDEESIVCVLL